jgi:hypothetical protein
MYLIQCEVPAVAAVTKKHASCNTGDEDSEVKDVINKDQLITTAYETKGESVAKEAQK